RADESKTDRIIEPGKKGSPIPGAVIAVNNATGWTAVACVCHIKIAGHRISGLIKYDALGANETGSKRRRRPIRCISNDRAGGEVGHVHAAHSGERAGDK